MPDGQITKDGLLFTSPPPGKSYLSVNKHRGNGSPSHKSVWLPKITPKEEHDIFQISDKECWICERGNLWGFRNQLEESLGTRGERLAKFPKPTNNSDPWHGYPFSTLDRDGVDAPSDELVLGWIERGIIKKSVGMKIIKRKL